MTDERAVRLALLAAHHQHRAEQAEAQAARAAADAYDQALDTVAAQLERWQVDYAKTRNPYRQEQQ